MRNAVFILALGVLILIGSWIPFGLAIKRAFDAETAHTEGPIQLGTDYTSPVFQVDPDQQVQIAVKLDVHSASIKSNSASDSDPYDALYSFPFSYVALDAGGREVNAETTFIAWDRGARSYTRDDVSESRGHVVVESSLEKFPAPASGRLRVRFRLSADDVHDVTLNEATLVVYHRVHRHTSAVVTGIVMVLIGLLVSAIGAVLLMVRATAGTGSSPAASPATGQEIDTAAVSKNSRDMAMWCHLSSLSGLFVPFGGLIGPIVIWAMKKDDDSFVNRHGIAAINFRISVYLYSLICLLLALVVVGFFLLGALALADLIFTVIAAIKASEGKEFTYPLSLRLIR